MHMTFESFDLFSQQMLPDYNYIYYISFVSRLLNVSLPRHLAFGRFSHPFYDED